MRSVLIVVFDGLQPAQVTPELMPNLTSLGNRGVTFDNHHSVFPTTTRANVASLVTGRNTGGHGLAANNLVVREFDPHRAIPALEAELAKIAQNTGRALLVPTLAEILSEHHREFVAIGVGTTGNAYLQNPTAARSGGATIHPDFTLPYDLHEDIKARFGPWPEVKRPNTPRMAHAVRIMTEYILEERRPAVSLIWSYEPDSSQHYAGVGSDLSNTAIHEADEQLGHLMEFLERTGRSADTDVLVVSDHGYSTITEAIDVEALMRETGFPLGGEPGGVVVASNGGCVLFYLSNRDGSTANRLANWLMEQPWCGTITVSADFADIPGTLPASLLGNEGPRAPDITMSFRWDSNTNAAGYSGLVYSTGGASGQGTHGSLSKHEIRNILFGSGPSFKRGVKLDIPSGNTDLAPTILRILEISGDFSMDGRVLEEAFANGPELSTISWSMKVHHAKRSLGDRVYQQHINLARVGNTTYVDEGNRGLGDR